MKIYLEMFEGNIIGWGSSLENAPYVDIDEGHDFFNSPSSYELVNGNLIKKVE